MRKDRAIEIRDLGFVIPSIEFEPFREGRILGFWFFRAVMPLSQIGSGGKAPNEATERREIGEATDNVGNGGRS